jgi:hypothetical protein
MALPAHAVFFLAMVLAPTLLWRPVAVPVVRSRPLPLAALLFIFQTAPELHLQPPARVGIVVIELALAARSALSPATLPGRDLGEEEARNGSRRSGAPQPGDDVRERGWVGMI